MPAWVLACALRTLAKFLSSNGFLKLTIVPKEEVKQPGVYRRERGSSQRENRPLPTTPVLDCVEFRIGQRRDALHVSSLPTRHVESSALVDEAIKSRRANGGRVVGGLARFLDESRRLVVAAAQLDFSRRAVARGDPRVSAQPNARRLIGMADLGRTREARRDVGDLACLYLSLLCDERRFLILVQIDVCHQAASVRWDSQSASSSSDIMRRRHHDDIVQLCQSLINMPPGPCCIIL